ncbi:MAG: FKBP-type peptidyl-prolyl cis-trans isomerase [Methanoregula sp.]
MKKSEKQKGKEKAAVRKKQYKIIGIAVAVVIIVIFVCVFFVANPFAAKSGDTVGIYYTGTLSNGTVFYSNMNGTPMQLTLGNGAYLADFEKSIEGMSVGETKTVTIPVDRAYGAYNPDLVMTLNRSVFPADVDLVPGAYYTLTRSSDNANAYVKLINVTGTTVAIDANHELAGQDLTFTIKLASIINP